jgi:hypothetical protein
MRSFKQNFFYKNLNIIRKLKDYADKEKVTLLLDEYNKKQEEDYFLTQKNIKIGRINTDIKNSNPLTYCQSPQKKNNFMNQRKQYLLNDNSFNSSSNAYSNFKRSYSISSRKVSRLTSNIETASVSKKNIIDNSDLKRHFHNIRQRINDYKTKKNHRKKLDIEVPLRIKQSLYKQEKFFKKIKREKTRNKKNEENIKIKTKKINIKDLLIYKSSYYDQKSLEDSILYKNLNKENKYRNNLWNITLRNTSQNGKYEKLGYLNVGNQYNPKYTFFNMNKNLEYFTNPNKNDNEYDRKGKYKRNLSLDIDDSLYNIKTRQNLHFLNNLKNLEINGKNLLDFEEERERKIKGNKVLYKNEYLEYLFNKKTNKGKAIEGLYEDKLYANNYNMLDFMKNKNLNNKCY